MLDRASEANFAILLDRTLILLLPSQPILLVLDPLETLPEFLLVGIWLFNYHLLVQDSSENLLNGKSWIYELEVERR
jgi:hypothetical protein